MLAILYFRTRPVCKLLKGMLRIFPVLGFTQNFLLSWLVQKMVCDTLFFYLLSSDRLLKGKALFCPFFLCKVHLHCMLSHLECTVALDSKINIIILMTFLFRKSPLQQSTKCCSWPWVGWDVTNNYCNTCNGNYLYLNATQLHKLLL